MADTTLRSIGNLIAGAAFFLVVTTALGAQEPEADAALAGPWWGAWIRDADTLDVRMRFEKVDDGWRGSFDSERLRVTGIPFTSVEFDPPGVRLTMVGDATTMEFEGRVEGDSLVGTYREDGAEGRFAFVRVQTADLPLLEEPARFQNGDVDLAGTYVRALGKPPTPAIVFVHGSRAEGRWASRFLADAFAREGVAALIYDKRGVGESTGSWKEAGFEDLAGDAAAAVAWLRARPEIDPHRVGVHGHSQGGTFLPMVAVRSDANFVVASAAAGLPMDEVEIYSIGNAIGLDSLPPDEAALARAYVEALVDVAYHGAPRAELESAVSKARGHAWFFEPPGPDDSYWGFSRRIAEFDPLAWWRQVEVPVLLVYGADDERVPPEKSEEAIKRALAEGHAPPVTTRIFPGADHTFRVRRPGDVWPRTVEGYPDAVLEWVRQLESERGVAEDRQ